MDQNQRNKLIYFRAFFIALAFTLSLGPPVWAAVILDDDFTSTAMVDTAKTNAFVDTVNGWVQLPKQAMPNAIALKEFGYNYAVVTETGIKFFELDSATGQITENPSLSITGITNPLGIAVKQDSASMWVLTPGELRRYDFDGSGMSLNPSLSVTGLTDVLSVSSQPNQDAVVVLSKSGTGTGIINYFQATAEGGIDKVPALSFDTGLVNPVAVAVVPGSPDLIVAAENGIYYYSFDAGSGTFSANPFMSVLGLTGTIGTSAGSGNSFTILNNMGLEYYLYSDGSGMDKLTALTISPTNPPVALSVKPGAYECAFIDDAGNVRYYALDQDSGTMEEIPSLGITGLAIKRRFMNPAIYQSVIRPVPTSFPLDKVRLTVQEQNDPGGSVSYQVSSDGGLSWTAITPDIWTTVPAGSNFVLRAILDTTDLSATPRILHVTLEATTLKISNLEVYAITFPPPGQEIPANTFPVMMKAGTEMLFRVKTFGYADRVTAQFSDGTASVLSAIYPTTEEENIWWGSYILAPDAVEGSPVGVSFDAGSTEIFQTGQLPVNPYIVTTGSVLTDLDLKLTY